MKNPGGVIPALLTPFDTDGEIHDDLLRRQISYFSNAGVHGLFACGTTAEGAYLSTRERRTVLEAVKTGLRSGQVACLAVLEPSTRQVLNELAALADLEPDFVSVPTPFYYPMSQAALRDHYTRIADASKSPVIIYNIPQNTHNVIDVETIIALGSHENIVGVKDSSGNFMAYYRGLLESGEQLAWLQGEDRVDAAAFAVGAPGLVTGLGNVTIAPYLSMYRAAQAGDRDAMNAEQRRINSIAGIIGDIGGDVIAAIKAGTAVLGRSTPTMRMAATTASDEGIDAVRRRLEDLGVVD